MGQRGPVLCWSLKEEGHRNLFNPFAIEKPERLRWILQCLEESQLKTLCRQVQAEPATDDEMAKVVSKSLMEELRRCSEQTQSEDDLEFVSSCYEDVFISHGSWTAAKASAGVAVSALREILTGRECSDGEEMEMRRTGFALCRPPGHHASFKDGPCGFCLANNMALTIQVAKEEFHVKRILVVDWDVHAGNGTQSHTISDDEVLFISIHRYDRGTFWPNFPDSNWDVLGSGGAEGKNVNVTLNGWGMEDKDYLAIFLSLILPLAREFQPELVLVSAGLDAALGDPEGEMRLSPACYAQMTRLLEGLGVPVLLLLEGGYFQPALEECSLAILRSLLGRAIPDLPHPLPPPAPTLATVLFSLFAALAPHWKCMAAQHSELSQLLPGREAEKKAEYEGSRMVLLPYPTRGDYLPRESGVEESFRARLAEIVLADAQRCVHSLTLPNNSQILSLIAQSLA